MNPDHTPLEAAQAELERFDRIADAVAEAPVHMARTQLREPLEDLMDIVRHAYGRHTTRDTMRGTSGAAPRERPTPEPSTRLELG